MTDDNKETQALGILGSIDKGIKDLLDLAKGSDRDAPGDDPDRKRRKIKDDAPDPKPDPQPEPKPDPKPDDPPPKKGFLKTFLGG
jgi:hypothetical protein